MKKILFAFLFTLLGVAFLATENEVQAQVGNKYYYKKTTPRRGPHNHQWVWTKRREYVTIGLNVNAMNYFGDIVPKPSFWSTDLRFTRPNIGIFVEKKFRPQFSARLGLNWGRVLASDEETADPASGHDMFRYIRNASFRNDIFELNTTFRWDLMSSELLNKEFYQRPKQFVPYVMGGLAVFYHAPKAKAPLTKIGGGDPDWGADEWTDLQPLGTEGQGRGSYTRYLANGDSITRDLGKKYSKVQIAIPLGFGIRKKLSNRIDIAFEFSYRFLLTDYLDDVSKNYVDLGVFEDDELAKAFHDRSLEGDRSEKLAEMAGNGELYRMLNRYTYTGVDGKVYNTFDGFGSDPYIDASIRGNQKDNDVYMLTGFHLMYIIPPHGVRCPVRFK